jgi:hypothetical protein
MMSDSIQNCNQDEMLELQKDYDLSWVEVQEIQEELVHISVPVPDPESQFAICESAGSLLTPHHLQKVSIISKKLIL